MSSHPSIETPIRTNGQIMIGTVAPIRGAAVAHDGTKTLAMLYCQLDESRTDILLRLEAAIVQVKTSGERVGEINQPSSDVRYDC